MQNNRKIGLDMMRSNPQMRNRFQVFWSIVTMNFFSMISLRSQMRSDPKMRSSLQLFCSILTTHDRYCHRRSMSCKLSKNTQEKRSQPKVNHCYSKYVEVVQDSFSNTQACQNFRLHGKIVNLQTHNESGSNNCTYIKTKIN